MTAAAYVVVFASTGNALLRPGAVNWQTRADMVARVETDGITGATVGDALARAASFVPGASSVRVVPLAEWRAARS